MQKCFNYLSLTQEIDYTERGLLANVLAKTVATMHEYEGSFHIHMKLEKEDDWFPQGNPKEINMDMYLEDFVH